MSSLKREEILEEAIKEIVQKGLSDFSIKPVSEKVGCSEALIYKYFPTKESLIEGCLERFTETNDYLYRTILPDILKEDLDPDEKLKAICKAKIKYMIEHRDLYKLRTDVLRSTYVDIAEKAFEQDNRDNLDWLADSINYTDKIQKIAEVTGSERSFWMVERAIINSINNSISKGVLENDDRTYELFYHILWKGLVGGYEFMKG